MNLSALMQQPQKPDIEPVLPLINVVFLLLIFFLMTGKLVKPSENTIAAPSQQREVEALLQEPELWLYVDRTGQLTFQQQQLKNLCILAKADRKSLVIFADAQLTGKLLNQTLAALAACGIHDIAVVTERASS